METKHTKGEWGISEEMLLTNNGETGSIAIGSNLKNRNWIAEAKSCRVNTGMPTEEWHANAKLIAAAPDLLEALLEIINASDTDGWKSLDTSLTKARNAIKKATI